MQAYCPAPNPPNHARRNTLGALRRWRGASGSMNVGERGASFGVSSEGPRERENPRRAVREGLIRSLSLGSSPGQTPGVAWHGARVERGSRMGRVSRAVGALASAKRCRLTISCWSAGRQMSLDEKRFEYLEI